LTQGPEVDGWESFEISARGASGPRLFCPTEVVKEGRDERGVVWLKGKA